MKIEMIEEQRFNNVWPWYTLQVNGEAVYSSWNKHLVEEKFNQIVKEGKFEKVIKTILKSYEVPVSLQEEKLNTDI